MNDEITYTMRNSPIMLRFTGTTNKPVSFKGIGVLSNLEWHI